MNTPFTNMTKSERGEIEKAFTPNMTALIFDKLMDNDQHNQFNVSQIDDCELSGNTITFTIGMVDYTLELTYTVRA